MDGLSIERIRPVRNLRPGVSRPFAELAGVAGRRRDSRLGAERPRVVFPQRQPDDGGRHLDEAGIYGRAAETAVRGIVSAGLVRRRAGWTLPDDQGRTASVNRSRSRAELADRAEAARSHALIAAG